MFLRFVLPKNHPDSGVAEGAFAAAYALAEQGAVSEAERAELESLLRWFAENLAQPTRFNRTRSKGYYRRAPKGISWFKPTAEAHLERIQRIAAILEEHGHHVTMIKTRTPGYLVYEDEHQIVAEPFREPRT